MPDAIKKLLKVGSLISLGYLFSLLLYPVASRYLEPEQVSLIGVYDSSILLMLSIIGFGVNAIATRDMALSEQWQSVLGRVQSARLTVAVCVALLSLIAYLTGWLELPVALVFCCSVIFALHYDFALYARGMPTQAAWVSLVRQAAPIALFLLMLVLGIADAFWFLALSLVFVFSAAVLTSRLLKVPLFYKPEVRNLDVYFHSAGVGIAGVFLAFQRFGFLPVYKDTMTDQEFVLLVTSLKILLFVTAFKRLLIQTFYNKLLDEKFSQLLDFGCFILASLALIICHLFAAEIAYLLFSIQGAEEYVKAIGWGTVALMFFAVSDSRLLLKHRDKWMYSVTISCGVIFTLCVWWGSQYIEKNIVYIYLLIAVELLMAVLYKIGLLMRDR